MSEAVATGKFVTNEANGEHGLNLLVEGMHCPSCVALIENALKKQADITGARLNLSTKRLKVTWTGARELGDQWAALITGMGYKTVPFDPDTAETFAQSEEKFLLRCLAVAGFASGNLMMFTVPIWFSDPAEMTLATRSLFQWVQALIAMPAIIYCGLPFYQSAWRAVREWRTNMDVPISVAVILATAMSLFETINKGEHAYFDSAVMLLFFLLIGRYLDARARGRARGAAQDLLQMMKGFATVLHDDGAQETLPLPELKEGMVLRVVAGEKIGADGEILSGISEIDTSLITGETMPQKVDVGAKLFAGTMNISAPITMRVTRAGEQSLLSEIVKLMETAEQSQAKYVTIADKISGWYTPAVHALAAVTFAGWMLWGDVTWQVALLYAATVLIITCPCALGLAVPVVQVLATSKLMRQGVLIKSGSALERLATISRVIFDKTGTLTVGKPELLNAGAYAQDALQLAASLAANSKHPLSRAMSRAYTGQLLTIDAQEVPGNGLEGEYEGQVIRLGKREWCGGEKANDHALELWLAVGDAAPVRFAFADQLRDDAHKVIHTLKASGLPCELLSGDRQDVVVATAQALGIENAQAGLSPLQKCERLEVLKAQGEHVLMVGDGLNDAPALALAHISMSPASAMDITQNAADIVFQGDHLAPVVGAWHVAKFSQVLVKQNFAISILYNLVAIPLAMAGYVTPVIAAIAMSSSSLLVIANAMRLNLQKAGIT